VARTLNCDPRQISGLFITNGFFNLKSRIFIKAIPWVSVALAAVCVASYCLVPFGSAGFDLLSLNQHAPFNLIAWITAHFTHSDTNHLFWNMAALLLLGYFIESSNRWLLILALVAGMATVDIWFFSQTQFGQYVGLSGALNSVFVVALYVLRKPGHWWRGNEILWLAFALAILKSIYEWFAGTAIFSNTRWQTTPSFHLVGMLAGILTLLIWHRLRRPGSEK